MKRSISIMATVALVSALATAPVQVNAAPKPVIEDPEGDGNFINDQGTGDGSFGDITGVSPSTVGDLLAVAFTNDKKNVYVHIRTVAMPPATQGVGYRVRVNPGPGGIHCLNFEAFFPGATNDLQEGVAHLRDTCNANTVIDAKTVPGALGTMIVVPRKAHEAFGKKKKLTAPQAQAYVWTGTYPAGTAGPYMDTTKVGADYKLKK